MLTISLALATLAPSPSTSTNDAEWGTFRGPDGTGVCTAPGLPDSLDPEGNLVWRTEIPKGYSSPILTGDLVLLTGADDEGVATLCVDAETGEVLWRVTAPGGDDNPYPGPNARTSSTPVTDGQRVVCFFRHFGLVAYDLEGEELWQFPIEPLRVPHGASTSPRLVEDTVILQCDQDVGSYLLALDIESGEERWKAKRPGITHGYSTPAIYRADEGEVHIVLSGAHEVSAYRLADGERIWWVDGMCWMPEAAPAISDDMVYISSYTPNPTEFGAPTLPDSWELLLAEHDADMDGKIAREEWEDPGMQQLWFILDVDGNNFFEEIDYDTSVARYSATGGFYAIQLGGEGDVTETHVRWEEKDRRKMPGSTTPLVANGVLYLIKEGGVLMSVDPTNGEMKKRARVAEPDQYWASPVAGDGKVYLAGLSGQLVVLEAGAEWEELSSKTLGEAIWATPALAEGRVVVRTDNALYSFEKLDG